MSGGSLYVFAWLLPSFANCLAKKFHIFLVLFYHIQNPDMLNAQRYRLLHQRLHRMWTVGNALQLALDIIDGYVIYLHIKHVKNASCCSKTLIFIVNGMLCAALIICIISQSFIVI